MQLSKVRHPRRVFCDSASYINILVCASARRARKRTIQIPNGMQKIKVTANQLRRRRAAFLLARREKGENKRALNFP